MTMLFLAIFHLSLPIMGLFWLGMRAERQAIAIERSKLNTLALWTKNSRRRRMLS